MSHELDELRAAVAQLKKRIQTLEEERRNLADAVSKSNQLTMKLIGAASLAPSRESDGLYEEAIVLLKEIHDDLTPRRNRP